LRVDVVKVLFVGPESQKTIFFEKAQKEGVIEFVSSKKLKASQDSLVQKFMSAIKVLRSKPVTEQVENVSYSNGAEIADEIIKKQEALVRLEEEQRLLNLEQERVSFFGTFSKEDVSFIENQGNLKFRFFYRIPSKDQNTIDIDEGLISIGQEAGMEYFVSLDKQHKDYEGVIEVHIERTYGEIKRLLFELNREISALNERLKELASFNDFLHKALIDRLNIVDLDIAKESVNEPIAGKLFAIEGWVPSTKLQSVERLSDTMNIYFDEIEIEAKDVIPTYLENKGDGSIGEDLVHIYDTPSITDKDPSRWVLWSFVVFFAMIISDCGYGVIFLILTFYLKSKFPNMDNFGKRMIKLSIMLSTACIIWGLVTTSFFGINISPNNPIRKLSFVDYLVEKKAEYHVDKKDDVYEEWVNEYPSLKGVTDPNQFLNQTKSPTEIDLMPIRSDFTSNVLFEFALVVGTVHLILSLLRNIKRSYAGIGWIIFMIGGYCYFPIMLHSTSIIHFALGLDKEFGAIIGMDMIKVGIVLALILALIQKKVSGTLEFMMLIQIFCDVLSYLRLYALGLAGMMMGTTFNELGENAGIVFGTIIIIVGHIINMSMAIMGGVIHGLRLNFLEWYHYSFEGGGRNFKPLKLLKK
jgi:V/A-type H+-transporting ATPase subunit I